MQQRDIDLHKILTAAPVVPVLTIESPDAAVPLARALVAGGLTAIEVTLRTAAALDCIRAIASEVEDCDVGAGTVLDDVQFTHAVDAGARFVVTPGASPRLVAAASDAPTPFLPGVATVGEAMTLAEQGFSTLKFFPAEAAGGVAYLKALAAPLANVRFCPTGGVNAANAVDYLSLANVMCVGGSWVAPADAVANGNWTRITALSREAVALRAA
ncbi:bifunctional 4-hydroxy-2-oxoglutarate aldolase/2-dehydro-3-deoxy-phosphogluconate aldolase [Bauldia sp.]|uniref:bifunctional 4-hydroxy-2-oxoglutarate aldolase/2-dehydro-3-deoxy-phosphogluconate aldolase n=1 Tax=Bauldia sp. TaxID=2575872 RepID=UPI003BA88191